MLLNKPALEVSSDDQLGNELPEPFSCSRRRHTPGAAIALAARGDCIGRPRTKHL